MNGSQTLATRPPRNEEIEVSIFGPGFGECLVIHLGGGHWAVVDSCRDLGDTGGNVAIQYLESIGVECAVAVKLIVLTHWHDDHIRGVGEVIDRCPSAKIAITCAISREDFLSAIAPWMSQNTAIKETTGLMELKSLGPRLRTLRPVLASHNKVIFESNIGIHREVRALSPSDASILACVMELGEVPKKARIGRIPRVHGNHTSVVLSFQIGNRRILLGGDLEVRGSRDHGWHAVIDSHQEDGRLPYEVFKASHHGSKNGDHGTIWEHMLCQNPHVILAPFVNGGVMLPTELDALRILDKTTKAWITAPPVASKFKRNDRMIQKQMQAKARKIQIIPKSFGQVRLRSMINSNPNEWAVDVFGDAGPLALLGTPKT